MGFKLDFAIPFSAFTSTHLSTYLHFHISVGWNFFFFFYQSSIEQYGRTEKGEGRRVCLLTQSH